MCCSKQPRSTSRMDSRPPITCALRSSTGPTRTTDKGPIVHAYDELRELATQRGRRFLFESTVMDGVPIFSLFQENLPALHLRGFRGILNSTTNVILGGMEEGLSFEASLHKAQALGVAETDAGHDIEGWDAAVELLPWWSCLWGKKLSLKDVQREGIARLTGEQVRAARTQGTPYKLVCSARRTPTGIVAQVTPKRVPWSDPLAWVTGTSSIVYFETDIFPGLCITEIDPGVYATAKRNAGRFYPCSRKVKDAAPGSLRGESASVQTLR